MSEEYELVYWQAGFPGRAEFVRLVFEEAGVKYKEPAAEVANKTLMSLSCRNGDEEGWPNFAPPFIKKGDFKLSNAHVICRYLGKKHNLYPDNEEDEFHVEQISQVCHDLVADGRLAFHGKDFYASYFDQQEETKPYIEKFKSTRLGKWLRYLEKVLRFNNGGKGFVVGSNLTYADLAVFHVIRISESQFPDAFAALKPDIPLLLALRDRIAKRPNMAAYLKSDRCKPFSGNSMM